MLENNAYDVFNTQCISRNILEKISDKWSILIIISLSLKKYRFGELRRALGGISQKMLAQTLQKLECYGLVFRQSYPIIPMKVEYSLTTLGDELAAILSALTKWTEYNMDVMRHAEKKYLASCQENY